LSKLGALGTVQQLQLNLGKEEELHSSLG